MKKFYGIVSLLCIAVAIGIGVQAIYQKSVLWSILYLFFIADAAVVIILAFCAKCPAKHECAHVVPGFAARIWNRTPGPYTRLEIVFTSVSMAVILLFPQYWLIQNTCLLVPFWGLCLAGLILIVQNICTVCENRFCPYVKKNKIRK